MLFLLAASDLDSVPAETVKYILIVLGWLATTGAAIYGGAKWSRKGTKEQPVAIEQPLNVRKHDETVRKSELVEVKASVTKLEGSITSLSDQINAQFAAMTKAGQDRAAAITQSIDEELRVIFTKIETFMLMTTRHDAVIPQIDERLNVLAKTHHDETQRIHARIDDAIRLRK